MIIFFLCYSHLWNGAGAHSNSKDNGAIFFDVDRTVPVLHMFGMAEGNDKMVDVDPNDTELLTPHGQIKELRDELNVHELREKF